MEEGLSNAVLVLFGILDIICIITVIFFERKNSASTIAWVLVLLSLPFVGFIAYVILGNGFHISKKKRYALKLAYDELYDSFFSKNVALTSAETEKDQDVFCQRMIHYLRVEGEAPLTTGNSVEMFIDGRELFQHMLDDLRKAKHHIHLLYYIFRDDSLGKDILAVLEEKAVQGVDVRLIYDSVGTMLASSRAFLRLKAAGGKVAAFSPFFSTSLSTQLRLNYRNHRKIVIIDGTVGYTGGMNVGVEYLGLDKRLTPWRDTHLRLTGASVWALQERFFMDWCFVSDFSLHSIVMNKYFPKPVGAGSNDIQIVSSGPDTTHTTIKCGLLEMIYGSRERLFIQTPYFTPDDGFMEGLRIAKKSGVDVRIMIPGIPDHFVVQWATLSFARQALALGIRVFMYKGFLHAKTAVFDSKAATVGTANIGNRSFSLNFEINAFIYNKDFAMQCEKIFEADEKCCTELTPEWFTNKPTVLRMTYSAARLFAPLI